MSKPQHTPDTQRIAALTTELLGLLGENPQREGLVRTPERVARAWRELTVGYTKDLDTVVNDALFHEGTDGDMVLTRNIRFYSLCEHHLLPFFGRVTVAYLPSATTIGLSKIPRIVDMFARRLQLQERLTLQIANALEQVLAPRGVAVHVEAEHLCVMMRGVRKDEATTATTCFLGEFKSNPELRAQFLAQCGGSDAPEAKPE